MRYNHCVRPGRLPRIAGVLALCTLVGACGSGASAPAVSQPPTAATASIPAPARGSVSATPLLDWPEFGLTPQRPDVSTDSTGITAANVAHLRRQRIALPGTVDSSPIYLHDVTVAGAARDVAVVSTTYGRTLALDASDGRTLWTFTPPGYSRWAGTAQITTATPLVDPDREFVYTASPNGLIHKLSIVDGSEDRTGSWPVSITRDPTHEKLTAALNIEGPDVIASTGGYLGDAPPYQGHVVLIDRTSGRLQAVFNTLCSDRRTLIVPSSCPASDSAILSRSGPVVEPGGAILVDTGNGPWNGVSDFGDSVLELSFPALRLRQAFTPVNQAVLNSTDTDLGSSAPALLGHDLVVVAGKDGVMRVLALSRLDGRGGGASGGVAGGRGGHGVSGGVAGGRPDHGVSGGVADGRRAGAAARERLGGELQRLPLPGGGELFTAPAVWTHGTHTTVFVAGEHGTGAYTLLGGRLHVVWQNSTPGTSPVMAGGLLYVYDPSSGGIDVYLPRSPRPIAHLAGEPGHWNSPIVVDGHVLEPEGNANDHSLTGTLDLFSIGG